jgi:hypothetical protein
VLQILERLLDGPIDYAGLFPPAQKSIDDALNEYLRWMESEESWILNRFVCSTKDLGHLARALERKGFSSDDDTALPVCAVGAPILDAADGPASLLYDLEQIRGYGVIEVEAYEIRLPTGKAGEGLVKRLKREKWDTIDLYVEFGWGTEAEESMHEAASIIEELGFKARTGGTSADAFPSVTDVAGFIGLVTALEAPFKFTAGLHEPFPTEDKELGVHRQGFLNVLIASALAMSQDLTRTELESILSADAKGFQFMEDEIITANHTLTLEEVEEWRDWFGGFGSCSVSEPLAGLKRLNLL